MPRLPTSLTLRARTLHPLLPLLLRPCRDLPSACNELRWLREHAIANRHVILTSTDQILTSWPHHFYRMCVERGRGKPLQYILGTQPFGELEMLCEKGVLIPRPETEILTTHLASLLLSPSSSPTPPSSTLRILDLCTGTGCIPLLLSSLLTSQIPTLRIHSIDISPRAITLAQKNLTHAITRRNLPPSARDQISFTLGDIFATMQKEEEKEEGEESSWLRPKDTKYDILISNPPYISPTSYNKTTSRSVRNYEPITALVPRPPLSPPTTSPPPPLPSNTSTAATTDDNEGDTFYPRLLEIATRVSARVFVVEVGDMAQAVRVARMVLLEEQGGRDREGGRRRRVWDGCEIWRDWPAAGGEGEVVEVQKGKNVRVRGEGNGRAVLAWRGEDGRRMVGK